MGNAVSFAGVDTAAGGAPGVGAMSPGDLAELVGAFSEVTQRLEQTHDALNGEVSRLRSELQETKGQLARARELAALGEMAAGIAHEVRNPLGSIRLYAEALVDDLADRPTERGVARRIVGSVVRLNAIVGDVLSFSRELIIRGEVVDVAWLLEDAAESCRHRASERDVEVRVKPPDDQGGLPSVRGDPGLLRQALVNVVSNAVDAASDGGGAERVVELSAFESSLLSPDAGRRAALVLSVEDTGPGMPPQVRERVFNPFFTTRETGTGLGLAIVHRIVDAHGGGVVIGERGGGGARVEIKLPAGVGGVPATVEHKGSSGTADLASGIAERKPPRCGKESQR